LLAVVAVLLDLFCAAVVLVLLLVLFKLLVWLVLVVLVCGASAWC
jgi:hypothetical protein